MGKNQNKFKTIESLLRSANKMTRRAFIRNAAILGVGMTAASGMWSKSAQAATPKRGGKFIVGMGHGSTTDSLDPATQENFFATNFGYTRHNHVAEYSPEGKLIPELAESWEASPDAKVWHFKVRKGVEFHNGKTIEAEDFVVSINHHRGDESKSPAKALFKPIVDVKKDDKYSFSVTLENGDAGFPYIISDYHVPVMPTKDGKSDWQSGIGAGPYVVEAYEPGVRALCKKFPNYWKGDARGHFDEIEMLTIADTAARTNALKTGSIHAMDRCDLKTVHLLKKMPGLKIFDVTGFAHYTMPMHTKQAPFDNNDVRLALKHAIDREALLKTVLRGYGMVGNDHPISPANEFHAGELPQRKYDPEKAKYYVKKSGVGKLSVELHSAEAAFAGATDAAVLCREHAAKAGIDIKVVRAPNDGYWSNIWTKVGWCMCYWGGRPTEDWMFATAYAADAAWNDAHWEHERFNKLLVEGRAELDPKRRREIYVELQSICRDEGGTVVPLFNNFVGAMADKVQHDAKVAGNWDLDGAKCNERWWFA